METESYPQSEAAGLRGEGVLRSVNAMQRIRDIVREWLVDTSRDKAVQARLQVLRADLKEAEQQEGDAAEHEHAHAAEPSSSPRRPAVVLGIAVLGVCLAIASIWWFTRTSDESFAVDTVSQNSAAPTASSPPSQLVVAVSGDVHSPGLVHLKPDARVVDAIEAAGGLLANAEIGALNLARPLADGELIIVGPPPEGYAPAAQSSSLNLNTATAEDLQELPGVGPVLAERIVVFRRKNGDFSSVEELQQVSGIGSARLEELREMVTV